MSSSSSWGKIFRKRFATTFRSGRTGSKRESARSGSRSPKWWFEATTTGPLRRNLLPQVLRADRLYPEFAEHPIHKLFSSQVLYPGETFPRRR